MVTTIAFSQEVRARLGDKATNELANWLNTMDANLHNQLHDMNAKNVELFRAEMAAGFAKVDVRFAQMDARFAAMDSRCEAMEIKFDTRFSTMESKLDIRFAAMESQLNEKFSAFEARLLWTMMGFWITSLLAIVGTLAALK